MSVEKLYSEFIDSLFGMKKETFYLILIFSLGFILRLIAAINLGVTADDMHHVTHAVNFFSADRLVTYDQSSGLWHVFTSVMYDWFGLSQLTSRLASLIFGSLTILVVFLLTNEFFNKKISLVASFLIAVAPFHIRNTIAEMDVMAMFFVLMSMLLFVRGIKSEKTRCFAIGGVFMGLAIYTKVYPLLFIPSLLIFFAYSKKTLKEKVLSKKNLKLVFVFLVLIFIFAIPAIAHNVLLYKDKGFMDLQFTRVFGLGKDISAQYYSWDVMFERKNSWAGLIFGDTNHGPEGRPLLIHAASFVFAGNPINFILGLCGLLFSLYSKENKKYAVFFVTSILFVFPFLASIILLNKHFIFLEILLVPYSAFLICKISEKVGKNSSKKLIQFILAGFLIFSLIYLGANAGNKYFYYKSHVAQVIEFKETLPKNTLMVADGRIYRGQVNWMFQERPYLEAMDFISALNFMAESNASGIPTEVYFFECAIDDCGWGTIKDQPDFNASMEGLTNEFSTAGTLVKEIKGPATERYAPFLIENEETKIRVYKAAIPIHPSVIDYASRPKNWFLYDIGYQPKENQFDYYETQGIFDTLLDKAAHWIVTVALILSFISILYIIYLTITSRVKESENIPFEK